MTDPSTRLERAIEQLGAEHEPPPGWQAQVLAAIESSKQPRPSPWAWLRRWWPAIPVVVVAAGAALLWFQLRQQPMRVAYAVEATERTRGTPPAVRGGAGPDAVALYSRIAIEVEHGAEHRALWVYRDGREIVAACPGKPPCAPDGVRAVLTVDRIGRYQVIALSSSAALPEPTGNHDRDAGAATGMVHGEIQQHEFEVQ
jgi:hypothetical protein